MKLPLYIKFITAYIIFGILGFITIAGFSSRLTHKYLIDTMSDTLYDEAQLIASTYSTVYSGNNIEISEAYNQLQAVATYLHAQIWLVNKDGDIVVDSSDKRKGENIAEFNPLAKGTKHYMIGKYFSTFPNDVMSVMAPVVGNFKTHGYIVIHLPMEYILDSTNKILNIVYLTCAVIFALSLLILIVFQSNVYLPLKKITKAAKEYADGNLKYQLKLDSHDEMGYLAATLNYMSDELSKAEDYQKDFITNISHDFRSPLTSIKGYLEAMLDGTIPIEMQKKYLHRVIAETERLTKLTSGILTLNSLDSKGYLKRMNFDINRVIKNTAASFEMQCSNKDITFDITFSDEALMVNADLGKIQQVLYNLIDNAIKFSHNSSIIYLSSYTKHEKIFVSIKDTGVGIDKKSLQKIFDRFYKSDSSRGRDKRGTGLGLSIVKEIIQSHGENIDVISTVDVGTEFVFTLSPPSLD